MKHRQNESEKEREKIIDVLKEDKRVFLKEWEKMGEKISYLQNLIERIQKKETEDEILSI